MLIVALAGTGAQLGGYRIVRGKSATGEKIRRQRADLRRTDAPVLILLDELCMPNSLFMVCPERRSARPPSLQGKCVPMAPGRTKSFLVAHRRRRPAADETLVSCYRYVRALDFVSTQ
jgi:hypothetical protein